MSASSVDSELSCTFNRLRILVQSSMLGWAYWWISSKLMVQLYSWVIPDWQEHLNVYFSNCWFTVLAKLPVLIWVLKRTCNVFYRMKVTKYDWTIKADSKRKKYSKRCFVFIINKHGIIVCSLKCYKSTNLSIKGNGDFVSTFKKWNSLKRSHYWNTAQFPFAGLYRSC